MSIKQVKDYFKQYEMDTRIQEFSVSSATVDLAASALGCEPERIAKTLSFLVNGQAILVVTSGDAKIDNKKFKEYFKTKAKMLPPHEVVDLVGHEIGGVCPFAIKNGVSVYLDHSLKRFETVYPACGSSNSAIELTIKQLENYSGYSQWIDVCKGWNHEFTQ
ncbi:YbaK/EbsC family protein [Bacillus altitudinis]|uniref:YbaK/EbsC family protein n=1 Tax=Bacillus altitudinis TaxID=293387 RepID=UPI001933774D|nr:YbaK/EbsC family protein [Bacillus altitudinis]MED1422339.1 YbaK/EbsC family protein [Bacillus altitudinis]MEE3606006.1 YbaK/EbsC family protein [Bacillus altitudinis]MEE3612345.1 YbaK/EbsC family protein [Bacillus altitudinis]MEE3648522.1 YbaK/EbsC family protein [Bacillus altitudinis]MEE4392168.1 YbaK/EbsC family protein [Bacillus altitudinis]